MQMITTRQLGKKYLKISAQNQQFQTLRDHFQSIMRPRPRQEFWALRHLSFSLDQGQVLGVIGPNGAGKSTLFKLLSQITRPTTGEIILHGSVSSLLEVGTGFHPELSGRENIYLSGTILGMKRPEITSKFADIVEFASIGDFLDDPVKYYSSGMYLRLAFAISAHLTSQIMIIDEVLAVGDTAFQKQCLQKIKSLVTTQGRTVLLVSHNLTSVQQFCDQVLWLDHGQKKAFGPTKKIIAAYRKSLHQIP